jgi:hypothetical protein
VIEKDGQALHARVYPVAKQSTYAFRDRSGEVSSKIEVKVADWKGGKVTVRDADGKAVEAQSVRHALDFVLEPGKSYVVTDGR